jgi:hypothetical protein
MFSWIVADPDGDQHAAVGDRWREAWPGRPAEADRQAGYDEELIATNRDADEGSDGRTCLTMHGMSLGRRLAWWTSGFMILGMNR